MSTEAHPSSRRLTMLPLWLLPLAAGVLTVTGMAIDASPLVGEPPALWGFGTGAMLMSILYGGPLVLVAAVLALLGAVGPVGWRAGVAWLAALLCCLAGLGLLVLGGSTVAGRAASDVVFGTACAVLGAVLLAAPFLLARRARGRA